MSLQAAVERLESVVRDGNTLGVSTQQNSNATADANVRQTAASNQPTAEGLSQKSAILSRLMTGLNEMLEIYDLLSRQLDVSNLNVAVMPSKISTKPVAPPTVLSINHLRVVYSSIELLWILGIKVVIAQTFGSTFDWNEAICPKSLLISKEAVSHLGRLITAESEPEIVFQCTQCIYNIISNSLFSANMLPRNLKRVLVALLVLSKPVDQTSPVDVDRNKLLDIDRWTNNSVESAQSACQKAERLLHEICLSNSFKSLVVSELRIAVKGPHWMRTAASDLFTKILLSDMGFSAVLRSYLEGAADDVDVLPLQIRVAKLVTSVPKGFVRAEYFTRLSPQIIELIKFAVESKDVSLQKVCVLVIMRISHLCGDVCDKYLVKPLTAALLSIDNEKCHLSQRGNSRSIFVSNTSAHDSVGSAESIRRAVSILHVLITICPAQQPLMASLQRSEVVKPVLALTVYLLSNSRDSALLPQLQDICRVMFATSSQTEYIAIQLHDVIIHATRNVFCISTDGNLTIERRMRRIKGTDTAAATAAEYAHRLGLSNNEKEDFKNNIDPNVISSPSELLSAKQAHSLKLSIPPADISEDSDGDGGRENAVRGPGWEVDDILSMAIEAATSAERMAATTRASLPLSTPLSSLSTNTKSAHNLWDLGMQDVLEEDEDDSSREYRADSLESEGVQGFGSAHMMLEVSVRAKAAAELLLLTEQPVNTSQPSGEGDGDKGSRGVSGVGEGEAEAKREGVAAELFMCCLQHFLTRPTAASLHQQLHEPLQVLSDSSTTADPSHGRRELHRGLSGLVLLLLQAHVPMECLLEGDCKILDIIGTVLKAYAADLEVASSPHQNIEKKLSHVMPSRTADARTGPLIEEISSNDDNQKVPLSSNKQSTSFMDEIRSIGGGDEVQTVKRVNINENKADDDDERKGEEGGDGDEDEEDESQKEMLSCVLGMLSAILTLGKASRTFKEESVLKQLMWPLQVISYRESDVVLCKLATDISLMLLTRTCARTVTETKEKLLGAEGGADEKCKPHMIAGHDTPKNDNVMEISYGEHKQLPRREDVSDDLSSSVMSPSSFSSSSSSSLSAFAAVLLRTLNEYCSSPEPYVRAMGLHNISTQIGDPTQALSEHDVDLATSSLVALLADSDSYVYLSALTALSRLADLPSMRGRVFQYLLKAYSCGPPGQAMASERAHTHTKETNQCDEERSEGQSVCVSTRHRALIGEALGTLMRRAGDAAPPLVPHLVAVCVRVARTRLSKEEENLLEGFADLRTMTLIRPIADGNNTSSNEVIDSTSSMNNKKEEQESVVKEEQQQQQAATAAAAVAGDSVFLRQSALSLLADAIVCVGWGASKYLIDIVDVTTGVLAMEGKKFSTQASSSARRSAAFLLRHLISGLREKLVTIKDGGLHLKAAYRSLKASVTSDDAVVVHHCQAALGALDEMMREQLFLSESQLRGAELPTIGIFKKPIG